MIVVFQLFEFDRKLQLAKSNNCFVIQNKYFRGKFFLMTSLHLLEFFIPKTFYPICGQLFPPKHASLCVLLVCAGNLCDAILVQNNFGFI